MLKNEFCIEIKDVTLPPILYGTAWKKDQTETLVKQAFECGFRGFDTACQPRHYHERGVGDGLADFYTKGLSRNDIYLQSKFTPVDGQDPDNIPYNASASLTNQVTQSFETSLRNLNSDYLDALILHSPLSSPQDFLEVWQAMEGIYDIGGVKLLGISNCYRLEQLQFLYDSARIKPSLLQNRFYAQTHYDKELRDFCKQNGMIYQSFWTLTANPHLLRSAEIRQLAQQYNRTAENIFFRYLTQQGIVPLTGTTNINHMREDVAIFEFSLSDEECAVIDTLVV